MDRHKIVDKIQHLEMQYNDISGNVYHALPKGRYVAIANYVMEDIESSTCERCEHFNDDGECISLDMLPDIGFGCNRFKRRDNGEK